MSDPEFVCYLWFSFEGHFHIQDRTVHGEHAHYAPEIIKEFGMTLLVPDTRHPHGNDYDLIFCLPVPYEKWNKWKALSDSKQRSVRDISIMDRTESGTTRTVVCLPTECQSDDDVIAMVAYMRMIEDITARVYVVRCTHGTVGKATIMAACIGANPDTLLEIEDET